MNSTFLSPTYLASFAFCYSTTNCTDTSGSRNPLQHEIFGGIFLTPTLYLRVYY